MCGGNVSTLLFIRICPYEKQCTDVSTTLPPKKTTTTPTTQMYDFRECLRLRKNFRNRSLQLFFRKVSGNNDFSPEENNFPERSGKSPETKKTPEKELSGKPPETNIFLRKKSLSGKSMHVFFIFLS